MTRMSGLINGLGITLLLGSMAGAQTSAPAPSDSPARGASATKDPYKDNPVLDNAPENITPEKPKEPAWPFTERGLDFNPLLSLRQQLEDHGISVRLRELMFLQNNSAGGVRTHDATDFTQKFTLDLNVDFGKLKLWEGGRIFLTFENVTGNGLTRDGAIGNYFDVNRLSSPQDGPYLKQYFFEQTLNLDSVVKTLKLRFDIGKMDVRGFFDMNNYTTDYRLQYLNRSFTNNPTFAFNDGVLGVVLGLEHEWAYVRAGVFNPLPAERLTGFTVVAAPTQAAPNGKLTSFCDNPTALFVGEAGFTPKFDSPNGQLPGNYRAGWWYNGNSFKTVTYNTYDGALPPNYESGLNGVYLSFDQMVWKENANPKDKQGIGAFFKYGTVAEKTWWKTNNCFALGASWTGPIPNRDDDVFAIGYSTGDIQAPYGEHRGYEQVLETYYNIAIFPWMVVGPDLQYIINPSGGVEGARDALVFGMRFYMTF